MKRLYLSLSLILVLTAQAYAKVVFLSDQGNAGGNSGGNGNGSGHGAVVCVEQGVGRVDGCDTFKVVANPGHAKTSGSTNGWYVDDGGGWLYHNDPLDPSHGKVQINCAHPDSRGSSWLNF